MIHSPRGCEDILPSQAIYHQWIEKKAASLFSLYGYRETRIPTLEKTELFLRSVGEETDVGKQMYTFKDKGGRLLSLRPEATVGIVRAYLQHKIYGKFKEWRVYYTGSMFRYERPQAGRLREFHQIGVENIGQESPWVDVEIIEMARRFLKEVGLVRFEIQLNSIGCRKCRPNYQRVLKDYLGKNLDSLCSTCQTRYQRNVLRVLDCKNPSCQPIINNAPPINLYLCSDCKEHFEQVKQGLRALNVNFVINPHLVRGLDYYTRTIFEIVSPHLGAQDAVCAGGRYDNLVDELGGPFTPAIGFAIGSDRLLANLEKIGTKLPLPTSPKVFIATLNRESQETQESQKKGLLLANLFRSQKVEAIVNFNPRSLSSQLRFADRENIPWVLIIGEEEIKKEKYILRNMQTGEQKQMSQDDLEHFSKTLATDSHR